MTASFKLLPASAAALLLASAFSSPLIAEETVQSLHVIKVGTSEADLIEADVSDLELGESRSFVTESGKTVDILKTPEGMEIYIDGERIDIGDASNLHHGHTEGHERKVVIKCDDPEGCDDMLAEMMDQEEENVFVMRREIEVVCDEDEECEQKVWIEGDRESLSDADSLHDGDGHKVIVIRKEVTKDSD